MRIIRLKGLVLCRSRVFLTAIILNLRVVLGSVVRRAPLAGLMDVLLANQAAVVVLHPVHLQAVVVRFVDLGVLVRLVRHAIMASVVLRMSTALAVRLGLLQTRSCPTALVLRAAWIISMAIWGMPSLLILASRVEHKFLIGLGLVGFRVRV